MYHYDAETYTTLICNVVPFLTDCMYQIDPKYAFRTSLILKMIIMVIYIPELIMIHLY